MEITNLEIFINIWCYYRLSYDFKNFQTLGVVYSRSFQELSHEPLDPVANALNKNTITHFSTLRSTFQIYFVTNKAPKTKIIPEDSFDSSLRIVTNLLNCKNWLISGAFYPAYLERHNFWHKIPSGPIKKFLTTSSWNLLQNFI